MERNITVPQGCRTTTPARHGLRSSPGPADSRALIPRIISFKDDPTPVPPTTSTPFGPRRLPLIPLSEEVCFPCTELRLRIVEPEYRRLVESVSGGNLDEGWLGLVLLRTGNESMPGEASVYGAGTAARLIDVDENEQGCQIVLEGRHRFEIERVVPAGCWREGWVLPMDEPYVSELDPDVRELRRQILALVIELSAELGERFALGREQLHPLTQGLTFEAMVNHLAANLDMAPPKKLQLLRHALPERALYLLTILRSRRKVLDVLRPYRHLAPFSDFH